MAPSKRRKGKHATARSSATRQSTAAAAGVADSGTKSYGGQSMARSNNADNKYKDKDNDNTKSNLPCIPTMIADENDIILASSKRRGVYECDYCHGDISQVPRIRCAVCEDFDSCLDCFTAKLVNNQASLSFPSSSSSPTASMKKRTPFKRGYRVCDSTRFPLFPTARQWSTKAFAQSVTAYSNNNSCVNVMDEVKFSTPHKSMASAEYKADERNANRKEESVEVWKQGSKREGKTINSSSDSQNTPQAGDTLKTVSMDSSVKESSRSFADATTFSTPAPSSVGAYAFRADDPKIYWTVEEDLRLLEGIQSHGLGNWVEIAEIVAGQGKTPKRCMERYLDDYLGRYGHILPMYTLIPYDEDSNEIGGGGGSEENNVAATDQTGSNAADEYNTETTCTPIYAATPDASSGLEDMPRASKRRATHFRSPGGLGTSNYASTLASRKKYKVVLTESIEGYHNIWPTPSFSSARSHVVPGTEVGRDQMYRAEQAYVKAIGAVQSKEEVDAIHKEWSETKLGKPFGPSVLPPRPEDVMTMPGAELAGFMPRREDFDIEWENEAEEAIGDMEFLPGDSEEDKQLKLKVLAIYNSKLDLREARKKFIIGRQLWDYRRLHQEFEKLPRDERDLLLRMRLFERFHTPEEHKRFLDDILKAKRLRKEIAKLQMYRRLGIRTLVEAEKYELDKARRQFHKSASAVNQNKENTTSNDGQRRNDDVGGVGDRKSTSITRPDDTTTSTSLWKQYRTNERRVRKSVNRGVAFESAGSISNSDNADRQLKEAPMTEGTSDKTLDAETTGDSGFREQQPVCRASSTLSSQETELCEKIGLTHDQYRDIKRVLVQESLQAGLLDKEGAGSSRRSLIKMDIVRRENLIDFFMRAGWVSSRLSHIARSLPQVQP